MAKLTSIYNLIILTFKCIMPIVTQSIEPNPHSDILYVLESGSNLPVLLGSADFQICVTFGDQYENVSWNSVQNPISVQVLRPIMNQIHLNSRIRGLTTVFFRSVAYLPKNQMSHYHLNDRVFYNGAAGGLFEIYRLKNHVIHQEVFNDSDSQLRRRMNFKRHTIETVHVNPHQIFTATGSDTLSAADWGVELLSYQLLAFMQDMLNFTVQFHNSSSWVYAASPTEPSMADLVLQNEVDLAMSNTGLWPTASYRFLYITRVVSEVYVYYNPPSTNSKKGFAGVVQPQVWICFLSFGVAIFVMTSFFFNQDIQNSFSWLIAILTERGVQEPKTQYIVSSRIFIFVTSAYGLLFYISLSAILISTLSINLEIKDLDELLENGYSFGAWQNSILDNGFKLGLITEKSPLYKIKKYPYASYASEQDGARQVVATKQFAYMSGQILFLTIKDFMDSIGACNKIKVLCIEGEKVWGSAFVKTGSEYADHFNFARLYMNEVGLFNHYVRIIEREAEFAKENCIFPQRLEAMNSIHLEDMSLVFIILLAGFFISPLIFLYEIWENRRKKAATEFQRKLFSQISG